MDVAAVNSAVQETTQTNTSSANDVALIKDDFLQLLVAQMRDQDPFSAAEDSTQFIQQLVSMTGLEQTQNLNSSIQTLIEIQGLNFALSSLSAGSALIGQEVNYLDSSAQKTQGVVESITLAGNEAYLNIKNSQTSQIEQINLGNITEVLGKPEAQ